MLRIIRVFPRHTNVTPIDNLSAIARTPYFMDEADEIHISVSFTWDIPLVERLLEKAWRHVAPVTVGGPALDDAGGDFIPGRYVKPGYIMTSRGCPNNCWFCSVPKREGRTVRELPITEGHNLLDSNILACSDEHIKAVFAMLTGQKKNGHRIEFTGGLEAARLKQWHVDALRELRPKQLFFAYDTPDDLEPLRQAGKMLLASGWTTTSHGLRAYVLCGFKGDTITKAQKRMEQTMDAGFLPMAMLYRDQDGKRDHTWQQWSRQYARAGISASKKGKSC